MAIIMGLELLFYILLGSREALFNFKAARGSGWELLNRVHKKIAGAQLFSWVTKRMTFAHFGRTFMASALVMLFPAPRWQAGVLRAVHATRR